MRVREGVPCLHLLLLCNTHLPQHATPARLIATAGRAVEQAAQARCSQASCAGHARRGSSVTHA